MNVLDDWDMDWTQRQPISRNIRPDNGLIYSAIELEAIWELIPNLHDITMSRESAYAYHRHAHIYGMSKRVLDHVGNIDDEKAMELLIRDTLKQEEDPLPFGLHEGCSLDCQLDHVPLENGD